MDKDTYRYESNVLAKKVIQFMVEEKGVTAEWIIDNLDLFIRSLMAVSTANPSTTTKFSVHYGLYVKSIKSLGTKRHLEYLKRGAILQDFGAFGMTELGHGSNVQSIETTAHYDISSK
jgi:alkylation response protein AidB-like acyl-CoA dehydrogenase